MRDRPRSRPEGNPGAVPQRLSPALVRIASAILLLAAVGFAVGLAYFIVVPGQRTSGAVSIGFWYGLPSLVVVLAVWALRSSAERRVGAALMLISAIASAFAAEALLRTNPERIDGIPITIAVADSVCPEEWRRQAGCLVAAAADSPYDRRTTLEVVQDFEAQGVEAWPSIDAAYYLDPDYEIDGRVLVPLSGGLSDVFTVFCNESGTWVTYESDEYGFNNPLGSHRPDGVQVAIVGDSFAHGWCVPFEQTLVGRMRLSDSTVLGVGLEGSGLLVQLGIEREYLRPLRPDVVVWLFYEGNDLSDFDDELSNDLLRRYLDPGFDQGLRGLREELEEALRGQIPELRSAVARKTKLERERRESARQRRESLAGWIRLTEVRSRLSRLRRSRGQAQPYDPAMFGQVAARMRDDVAEWGGKLLFSYMPTRRRFEDPSTVTPHRSVTPHRADILALVRALGIPTVDLYEPMSEHPDPLSLYPFRLESHVTAEGFDLLARALADGIEQLAPVSQASESQAVGTE
jgi:hypothetical protein